MVSFKRVKIMEVEKLEKLLFLSKAKDFEIIKAKDGYEVHNKDGECDLVAFISNDKTIKYYLTGLYNTGLNWHEINFEELENLKIFCEMIIK